MANNIYENKFYYYFINYYMIARYKVSAISSTKSTTHIHQLGSMLCRSGSWSCFSQIRIETVHTANGTAITSAMWNIAHASTKQNYIV